MNPLHPSVVGDLKKRRSQRRKSAAVFAVVDELERRLFLSGTGTLSTIAAFNGANGETPLAVVQDSQGNLFGITTFSQAGSGEIFEVPVNSSTVNVVYTFPEVTNPLGNPPLVGVSPSSLIIDSSGNLYGSVGGLGGSGGSVFELAAGTTTPTTLATLASGDFGRVTAVDSAGDLFGIGATADGTFQVLKNSGMVTPLADAVDQLGGTPADLQLGPDGNLYGVSNQAEIDSGYVFEVSPATGSLQIIASLGSLVGGSNPIGLTFDSSGNIWGFSEQGGPDGQSTYDLGTGTVWELPMPVANPGPSTIVNLIASFGGSAAGTTIVSQPVFDSAGNLYGITENGGANGDGTVFDLPAGSTTLTDLYDWTAPDPGLSEGIVTTSSGIAAVAPATTTTKVQTDGTRITPSDIFTHDEEVEIWNSIFSHSGGDGYLAQFQPNDRLQTGLLTFLLTLESQGVSESQAFADARAAYADATGVSPADVHQVELTAEQTGVSGQIAQIKAMLSTGSHELNEVKPQVNLDTKLLAQETKEESLITALNAQLAAQTNPAKQAAIQKKIAADTAVQTKVTNQESTVYNTALTALDNIQTLQGTITAALAALPTPVASLSGVISTVPALLTPGKKASAIVTVTNTGNAGTPLLSFQVAISARPPGTTGSADIPLATVPLKVHLKAGASAPVHLNFAVPKTLPAGTYSLVVEPLPNSAFSGAPTPIVSETTFTVP